MICNFVPWHSAQLFRMPLIHFERICSVFKCQLKVDAQKLIPLILSCIPHHLQWEFIFLRLIDFIRSNSESNLNWAILPHFHLGRHCFLIHLQVHLNARLLSHFKGCWCTWFTNYLIYICTRVHIYFLYFQWTPCLLDLVFVSVNQLCHLCLWRT